jgi:hypothetical protein
MAPLEYSTLSNLLMEYMSCNLHSAISEITRLEKCIVSTMIGYNMIFCIAIGCATRAIANNFHAMHFLLVQQNVHDVITNFCLLDAIYKWFIKDVS